MFILLLLFLIMITAVATLILIFISGIISNAHGVPYVPIKRKQVKRLLSWGGLSANDIFYDLGCGDARLLIGAVKDFGVKKAIGYEIAPWPYFKARLAVRFSGVGERVSIRRQNFFQADLSNATFVYAYLFPKPIDQLAYKLAKELGGGSKILCPSFPINLARHPEFKLLKSEKIDKITAYLYEKI